MPHQILFGLSNREEWDITHGRGGDMHTEFWWRNLRGRDHLKDLGADGKIILKLNFNKYNGGMDQIDLLILRTDGGLF
jgi:hypothetical protein